MTREQWAERFRKCGESTISVATRSGSLVHIWNRHALRPSRTFCGREAFPLNDWSRAVTCSVCVTQQNRTHGALKETA